MTDPAESGAGDGMGRAPRDTDKHPPTNSTEALEAELDALEEVCRGPFNTLIDYDAFDSVVNPENVLRLLSHLRELQEENARQGFLLSLMAACAEGNDPWVGEFFDQRARAQTAEALASTYREENERLREIADLARELISPRGMVNRGVDRGLVVVEKADRSDPHYRLCTVLEALTTPETDR